MVHSILSYDGLRQRCDKTFSKSSLGIVKRDSQIHL